jgi:hypothetical protein
MAALRLLIGGLVAAWQDIACAVNITLLNSRTGIDLNTVVTAMPTCLSWKFRSKKLHGPCDAFLALFCFTNKNHDASSLRLYLANGELIGNREARNQRSHTRSCICDDAHLTEIEGSEAMM